MNTSVTVARKNKNFAGAAPVVFRSAKSVLKKTSGESVMVQPGSVLTVNVS